jgi:uncharacterized RDD family membrane protein YckC
VDPERRGDLTARDPLGAHYGDAAIPPGVYSARTRERPAPPGRDELAGWWRRAVASVVDGVIVGALTVAILAALGVGVFAGGSIGVWEVIAGLLLATVLFAALALLYAPLVMARTNGQTLGKMAAGCRVVRADGRRVDFLYAVLREVLVKGLVLGVAGSLTGGVAYLVDFAWPLVDPENRALHDLLVDSRVVRA